MGNKSSLHEHCIAFEWTQIGGEKAICRRIKCLFDVFTCPRKMQALFECFPSRVEVCFFL
jgi:hypothetical protein